MSGCQVDTMLRESELGFPLGFVSAVCVMVTKEATYKAIFLTQGPLVQRPQPSGPNMESTESSSCCVHVLKVLPFLQRKPGFSPSLQPVYLYFPHHANGCGVFS